MKYVKWISLVLKIIPCVIAAAKAYEEAKKDDGEVDMAEGLEIAEAFFKCIIEKMGINLDAEEEPA